MTEKHEHYNIGLRYKLVLERAASTKGVIGWKIEVNSDSKKEAIDDICELRDALNKLEPLSEEK